MTDTIATLETVFTANTSGFDAGLGHVNNSLSGALTSMGGKLTGFGTGLGLLSAPMVAFGVDAISAASDFDSAMAEISARTGLVGEDLQNISDFALQMGADTVFSAGEASDAFLQLLSSGQSAEQAVATLPSVLSMAAASGEALGTSADTLTDIMAMYGLEVEDAAMVTEVLAQAAGASSADIASLGQGFANVGGVANQFGLDVAETAAVLAIFAENGIKGAEAGTQLKSMLLNMTRDTEEVNGIWEDLGISFYDAAGAARPLADVIADLDAKLDPMPAEAQNSIMQKLGGSYGVLGLNALRGSISIDEMNEMMSQQTGAAEMAEARMGTFAGAMDSLKGSIETLQIQAMTPFMNDTLKPMAQTLTGVINKVTDWAVENPKLTRGIILAVAAVAGLAAATVTLGLGMTALGMILAPVGALLGLLISPIGLLIAGVALLGLAFATNFMGIQDAVMPVIEAVGEGLGQLAEVMSAGFDSGGLAGAAGAMVAFFADGFNQAISFLQANGPMLAQTLLDAIGSGLSAGANWVYDNLIVPAATALTDPANWAIAAGALLTVMAAVGQAEIDAFSWVSEHIISPLIAELTNQSNWIAAGAFITTLLTAAAGATADMGEWALTNVITPLFTALTTPENWQAAASFVGTMMGFLVNTGVDFAGWAMTNVVSPLYAAMTNPENWAAAVGFLGVMLSYLANAETDFMGWARTNIVYPLFNALTNPENWVDAITFLPTIMGYLIDAGFDFVSWVGTNIAMPMATAFIAEVNWAGVSGLLNTIFGVVAKAGFDFTSWVQTNIITPMVNAINGMVSQIAGAMKNLIDTAANAGVSAVVGALGFQGGGFVPEFDTGGWTGSGGRNQVAGVVHGGEYVVPAGGMYVEPTPGGLRARGGGSGGGNTTIILNGNNYGYDDLNRAMQEAMDGRGY